MLYQRCNMLNYACIFVSFLQNRRLLVENSQRILISKYFILCYSISKYFWWKLTFCIIHQVHLKELNVLWHSFKMILCKLTTEVASQTSRRILIKQLIKSHLSFAIWMCNMKDIWTLTWCWNVRNLILQYGKLYYY